MAWAQVLGIAVLLTFFAGCKDAPKTDTPKAEEPAEPAASAPSNEGTGAEWGSAETATGVSP